ncbi:CsbD family protein [Thalassococcus sp. S3]|uniref:CsbD family protein n=1 Tax=Thalassococcus sp. S3 TaxID=2017482 RepID=UPI0026B77EE9
MKYDGRYTQRRRFFGTSPSVSRFTAGRKERQYKAGHIVAAVVGVIVIAAGIYIIGIDQKQEGEPSEISVEGGELPEFDAEVGQIEVVEETVTIPGLEVTSPAHDRSARPHSFLKFTIKPEELDMNRDQIEGKWTEIKGKLRETYGELSDNDIEQAKGDREQLEGKLQQKLGKSKEEVRDTVDRILSQV